MFIYKITNKINGKIYIGQTLQSLKSRFAKHCDKKYTGNRPISAAIQKYGKENFNFEEIDGANSLSELNYREWLWIHKLNCMAPNGYNLKEGGKNGHIGEYQKTRIRLSNKSRIWTEESKSKISKSNAGWAKYKVEDHHKKKFSSNTTKQWTNPEIREKMITAMKKGISEAIGRKVVNLINGEIYNTVKEAERKNNCKNMFRNLNGLAITCNKKVFKYLEKWDGELISKEELEKINKRFYKKNENPYNGSNTAKKIINLENQICFESITSASKFLGIERNLIRLSIKNSKKYKNLTFKYI